MISSRSKSRFLCVIEVLVSAKPEFKQKMGHRLSARLNFYLQKFKRTLNLLVFFGLDDDS